MRSTFSAIPVARLFIFTLAVFCLSTGAGFGSIDVTGRGWPVSSPEEQGMDSQMLAGMVDEINERKMKVHSLLVIRNGYLVSETYFDDFQPDTRHHLQSVTKSFISTLIGIAIDQGYLTGADQRVIDLFLESAIANLDNQKQDMTLEDLLTMRSGLDCQEGDIDYQAITKSPDGAKYMLDKPMIETPGSRWNYCSGGYHVLSAIIQQSTGKNALDFAEQNLFKPLGISNVVWPADKAGNSTGGWGLQLTPRDMAKLGYLYLRGGQWDGQQIVSSEWAKSCSPVPGTRDGYSTPVRVRWLAECPPLPPLPLRFDSVLPPLTREPTHVFLVSWPKPFMA